MVCTSMFGRLLITLLMPNGAVMPCEPGKQARHACANFEKTCLFVLHAVSGIAMDFDEIRLVRKI